MALTFRWLLRMFLALTLLSLVSAALAYYLAARSLPDYSRNYTIDGPRQSIEIIRDTHNVPHILAKSDHDGFFGLGFVHAQDRLWQMIQLRRTIQGRLSEQMGIRGLKSDEFLRRLDLYGLAQASFQYQGAAEKAALSAYSDGVNAWIETVRRDALGRGAPEFFLFSPKIQPWRPADSLAILKFMSLQGSGHLRGEILRARTSIALGVNAERLRDILPDAPGPGATALPAFGALFPDHQPDLAAVKSDSFQNPIPAGGLAGASNAWAAAPFRSAGQGTLLANDPHNILTAPSVWMLARIRLVSGDVIGGTIPGMPLVLAGRSQNLGWGISSSFLDDQDIHIEKLNPDDPGEYLTPDGYKAFVTKNTLIKVKGSEPRQIKLRWTENGPVLPSRQLDLGSITPSGHVAVLSATFLSPVDQSMTAMFRIMQSGSVEVAIEAGRLYTSPSQNLTLIDKQNIGFQLIGKMPARNQTHQSKGRLPSPGWLVENRWQGYLPYENNPRIINPASGLLANTNNKIVDRPFPNHVSYAWGDSQRIERLQKLLGSRKVHTAASFIEAQSDQVSFSARSLLPLIARDLWFEATQPAGAPHSMRQSALKLLAEWNGEMNEHMPEPLIYAAWMRALQLWLIQDELGPIAAEFSQPDPVFLERVFRNVNGAGIWCDVAQSTPVETCAEIARLALNTALLGLASDYGERVESWRWGDAHQATHDHPALGDIPLLSWLVNIRQSTSGGDNTLMRGKTTGKGPNPYLNVHGAGYRGVYDFADPDSSLFIISTGQSGHFMSRHYDDLARLWRRGEYIPMSLDPDQARAAAVGTTYLVPLEQN